VEREQYSLAHQAQSSILADIVGGTFSSSAEVYSRARALGIDLINRDFVGLTVRVEGRSQPVDILENERVSRADAERVSGAVEAARLPTLVGTLDEDRVNVLIAIERGHDPNATLLALASSIHRSFAVTATARSTIGVGSVVQNLREVRRSFVEAEQAAAAAIGSDRPFNRLSDVRIRGLTRLLRQDARLQTFIERELGELIAYDEAHGTDLIEVLGAYLAAGGNKSVAAREVSLSRPAFYHRMAKIEAVANMDLESPESRTSLHLALLSLEAMREPSGLPGTDGRFDRD
jgi:purine catabolism regulator